jgi:hypothetical protein
MERAGTLSLRGCPLRRPPARGRWAGTIAPHGLEVLLKTYVKAYYWKRASSAEALFASSPETLPKLPRTPGGGDLMDCRRKRLFHTQ